jgi:hypothetical protein
MRSVRIRRVRSFFVLPLVLGFVLAAISPSRAQSDTGEITITVVDAQSGRPVVDARTILVGPQTASSLTTAAGIIHYTDVPVGIYRVRVVKRGYEAGVSKEFDVLGDRALNVRVALALSTGGLKVIGSITAHASVSVSSTDISDSSPIRRLSDSLTDALDKIAGVSVTQDATDPNSPVTVSLNGHDESQTAITLDGIPLSAPGSAANLRAIGTDLFTGSSVSTSPSAGALGGGVNFRTLQPTQSLQFRSSVTTGTFDRSNYSFAATGSVGSLGIAVQHTGRDSNSPLTFQDYEDQSGLTYPHDGESHSYGDFVKFRYRLGDDRTTVSGTALTNNLDAYAICARDVTVLPCGIGPDNQNYGRFAFAYGTVQSLVGTVATQFTAYTSSGTMNVNDANRYAILPEGFEPGIPGGGGFTLPGAGGTAPGAGDYFAQLEPSLSSDATLTRGVAYSASIAQGRHTVSLSGNTYSSTDISTPTAGSEFETAYTNAISSSSYQIADSFKSNDKLTLSPRLSIVNTTTLGTSVLGGFGATWRPRAQDTYGASINLGSSQPSINLNHSFSDPLGARFDCQAGTAVVSGPGDTNGGAQSAVSLDANWTHQFVRGGGQISVDAFSQVQTGQVITAQIEEPLSYFDLASPTPGLYTQTLYAVYRAPSVCGLAAATPRIFVAEPVSGTRRIYQGINASGRFGIGRYFVALPNYTLNVAELTAASARLSDGPSTTIVGAQLPNRPVHRAGITLDGYLPRSAIELLANAQYTGANNQQNIGPYMTVAAGISHGFGPGVVTLFENNVFDTYGGIFATDAGVSPLPLSDGEQYRTAATPLTPRTISLSYVIAVGGPKPGPAIAAVSSRALAQAAAPSPEPSGSPGARGGPGRFVPVAPPPGADPLSLATTRSSCDADAQAAAKPAFDALRAYIAAYEAKTALPVLQSVQMIAHIATADPTVPYYFEMRPNGPRPAAGASAGTQTSGAGSFRRGGAGGGPGIGGPGGGPGGGEPGGPPPGGPGDGPPPPASGESPQQRGNSAAGRAFRGFVGCAYITVWTSTQAKAKGIDTSSARPGLLYVPHTGFVFVRPPELPQGGGSLKQGS